MRTWRAGRWLILVLHLALPLLAMGDFALEPEKTDALDVFAPAALFALYGLIAALIPPDGFFGRWRNIGWVVAAIFIDVMAGTLLMIHVAEATQADHRSFAGFGFLWLIAGGPACLVIWPAAWATGFCRRDGALCARLRAELDAGCPLL